MLGIPGCLNKAVGPTSIFGSKGPAAAEPKVTQVVEHGSTDFPCLLGGETQDTTTPKPQLPHLHGELA